MEPGEGSAAPKATVALPGTDVNPAGRAPARLAVHCNFATGGPGAATRHAPFGRPRHPLGTFPCGKVPRPPAGGRNLPQETDFLWEARKRALLSFFCFSRDFASAEATRGLCARPQDPVGAHPYMRGQNLPQETNSLQKAGKGPTFLFPVSQRISPLRRRPKGFPLAPWTPSGKRALRIALFSNKTIRPAGTRRGAVPYAFSGGSPQTLSLPLPMLLA